MEASRHTGECFGENIVERFAVFKSFFELRSLRLQLLVGKARIFVLIA